MHTAGAVSSRIGTKSPHLGLPCSPQPFLYHPKSCLESGPRVELSGGGRLHPFTPSVCKAFTKPIHGLRHRLPSGFPPRQVSWYL